MHNARSLYDCKDFLILCLLWVCLEYYGHHMTRTQNEQEGEVVDGKVRKSVLIPPDTLKDGQKRARAQMRNFSNYVAWLIDQDVKANGAQPATAEVGA